MKRVVLLLVTFILVVMACQKAEPAGPSLRPTIMPPVTMVPIPPCKSVGPTSNGALYQGGCEATDKCKITETGETGNLYEGDCHTKGQ